MVIAFLARLLGFEATGLVFSHRSLSLRACTSILQRLYIDLGHPHHGSHHLAAVRTADQVGQTRIVDLS